MNIFEVYLILQADDIKGIAIVLGVIGLIASIIYRAVTASEFYREEEATAITLKRFKYVLKISLTLLAIGSVTPSTKTIVAMYAVPSIVNNEKVQMLPEKILDLIDKKVDEALGK